MAERVCTSGFRCTVKFSYLSSSSRIAEAQSIKPKLTSLLPSLVRFTKVKLLALCLASKGVFLRGKVWLSNSVLLRDAYLVGSSKNIIGGLLTSSNAIERRFFWPPDKLLVIVFRCSARPNVSKISWIWKKKTEFNTILGLSTQS